MPAEVPKYSTQRSAADRDSNQNQQRPQTASSLLKTYIAQAPHLPSHVKPARLGAHKLSSEPNEHANSAAHSKFLVRAERSHDSDIDALECRRIRHARAPNARSTGGGGDSSTPEVDDTDDTDVDVDVVDVWW